MRVPFEIVREYPDFLLEEFNSRRRFPFPEKLYTGSIYKPGGPAFLRFFVCSVFFVTQLIGFWLHNLDKSEHII